MATLNKGYTFTSGDVVTPTKLNNLMDLGSATIGNSEVTTAKIADANVTTAKLADANVTTAKIADANVTTAKIADANVTTAKIADAAITGAAGGGKLAASAITGQTQLTDPLANGDEFLVHDTSSSALRRVAFNAMQATGSVLQTIAVQDASYKSLTWTSSWGAPTSNVALVSTAGAQIISGAITPRSTANKVLVTVSVPAITANTTYDVQLVLFRGTVAIQSSISNVGTAVTSATDRSTTLVVVDEPNATSATTYSVRVAQVASNSGTIYINGAPTGAAGGGAYKAVLIMQEIKG
jgi:hypothetical protein